MVRLVVWDTIVTSWKRYDPWISVEIQKPTHWYPGESIVQVVLPSYAGSDKQVAKAIKVGMGMRPSIPSLPRGYWGEGGVVHTEITQLPCRIGLASLTKSPKLQPPPTFVSGHNSHSNAQPQRSSQGATSNCSRCLSTRCKRSPKRIFRCRTWWIHSRMIRISGWMMDLLDSWCIND